MALISLRYLLPVCITIVKLLKGLYYYLMTCNNNKYRNHYFYCKNILMFYFYFIFDLLQIHWKFIFLFNFQSFPLNIWLINLRYLLPACTTIVKLLKGLYYYLMTCNNNKYHNNYFHCKNMLMFYIYLIFDSLKIHWKFIFLFHFQLFLLNIWLMFN